MRNFDMEIARQIQKAQFASTMAKQTGWYDVRCRLYEEKDKAIQKAISLIIRSKSKVFHFSIGDDSSVPYSHVVYFTSRIDGKRYQVSFHSFGTTYRYRRKGKSSRWDKKSSWDAAKAISHHYGVTKNALEEVVKIKNSIL